MTEKYTGKLHHIKEQARTRWDEMKEQGGAKEAVSRKVEVVRSSFIRKVNAGEDYDHHYRRKSRKELVTISAAVMGIEFAYAAETAFVSPTLLKIGVSQSHMTLIWCLSPLVGFFLTPILGSLSDRCKSALGRRRPFIILLSIGVVLGLLLVPNGKALGKLMGDKYYDQEVDAPTGRIIFDEDYDYDQTNGTDMTTVATGISTPPPDLYTYHPWGIFFTIIGTVLLDFDADACQSPSRAYLLDVTLPEDHAIGLATFTIMAGLGGSLGYAMGGIDWGTLGTFFGGHVRFVFTIVLFIFIFCVLTTITSFNEIPLDILTNPFKRKSVSTQGQQQNDESTHLNKEYLNTNETQFSQASPCPVEDCETDGAATVASLKQYLWSIIYMPSALRWLCLTNLFCWSSLVCYSLYFTDFVGQAVFMGNPRKPEGSPERQLYDEGVRFACWGMSMYSLSCSCYSFLLDKMVAKFRAKPVYIGGQLIYSVGMVCLALTRTKWAVLVFSWTAGVMYSTLFTMPYLLVAHYHETDTIHCEDTWFLRQIRRMLASIKENQSSGDVLEKKQENDIGDLITGQVRGIGTDVAIVSAMVFLAQFILSSLMGSLVQFIGSTVAVVICASVLSFCGAVSANFITYMDL